MPSRVMHVGERVATVNGYIRIKTGPGRSQYEHVAIAERAIGHSLPAGARVHHIDDDGTHNIGSNLCILQDENEHQQLHVRRRILRAGGNPWTDRICSNCGPCPKDQFYQRSNGRTYGHCRACNTEVCRRERLARELARVAS